MTTGTTPPRRVRVTSPRASAGRPRRATVASEIDAQTRLGEVYMASLLRAQLRLAILVIATLALLVGTLPLLFSLVPRVSDVSMFGMPLPWLLLGFLVYPVLVALGWF